jgi:hypothetical protein
MAKLGTQNLNLSESMNSWANFDMCYIEGFEDSTFVAIKNKVLALLS